MRVSGGGSLQVRLELIGLIQRTHGFVEDYHERTFGLQHDGIQSTRWSPGDEVAVRRVMERADRLRWLWTYGEYLAAKSESDSVTAER